MRTYKVIYDLLDDMRAAMEGQLRSVEERIPLGQAEVRPEGLHAFAVLVAHWQFMAACHAEAFHRNQQNCCVSTIRIS